MYKQYKLKFLLIGLGLCLGIAVIYSSWPEKKPVLSVNMQGKTVVIDPGHGGEDVGCTDKDKIQEKNITLAMAHELAKLLKQQGAEVRLTRSGDYQPGCRWFSFFKTKNELDERVALAVKSRADIFLSLHINSSPHSNRAGAVVYYNETNNLGRHLAQSMQRELRYMPEMGKRRSQARNYYLLNCLPMPAVVIELGNISSSKDRRQLVNPGYRRKMVQGLCTGIINYFNYASGRAEITMSPELPVIDSDMVIDPANAPVEKAARLALEQLVENSRQRDALSPCIPPGLKLRDLKILGSLATVDLAVPGDKSGFTGSEGEWLAVSSIAFTLWEFPEVRQVQILANGKKERTLAGHIDISEPLTRNKLSLTRVVGGIMAGKKAKVAIVIDDFGQSNPEGVKEMMAIDRPLTFAVMPNLEHTHREAVQAAKQGYEVIVHLPMQPVSGKASWLGPGAITADMTAEEIRRQVRQDFAQVPYATGFNNHMGSLITSKTNLVCPILEVAGERGLFVLDSRTSEESKMTSLAAGMGVDYVQRDIFLDDVKSIAHMKQQLKLLAEKALDQGSAVGIGHVGLGGRKMARAIQEMIPEMEAKGIEFVYLSELVH